MDKCDLLFLMTGKRLGIGKQDVRIESECVIQCVPLYMVPADQHVKGERV